MRQTAPRRPSLRGAAGLLFLALACAQVLDVDGLVIVSGGPTPAQPPPQAPVACTPGQLHCEGVALQICRTDQSGFRTARVCSSAALCCDDPSLCPNPGCQPPVCTPGDFKCDDRLLSVCNEGLTGWTPLSTCPSAAQCNAKRGGCDEQPCNAATPDIQCSDATRLACTATGWTKTDECPTHALCSTEPTGPGCQTTGCLDVRGASNSNLPSPFRCFNGDLQRCNDDQTEFEFVETCLNLLHCNDLRDVVGDPQAANLPVSDLEKLGCTPAACTPGKFRCDGSLLLRCNQYRTDYQLDQDCGSAGRCDASSGSCSPQDCVPEKTQCSGSEFQVCTAAHTWQTTDTCVGAGQCDPSSGCRPAVCEVTEFRCNGAVLERCNVDGTDWIGVHSCETEALCNAAAKRCDPPRCLASALRCSPDAKLERCSPGRDAWQTELDCRERAQLPATATPEQVSGTCDPSGEGRCNSPPSCPSGALRCNGQYLEHCQDNAWRPREWCATSALCDASGTGSCHPPSCKPGEYRCVMPGASPVVAEPGDSMRGLTLQVCDASGTSFANVRDCASDNFCDSRHGQCDLCEALAPLCFGGSLYRCSADGQERELEKACTSGCMLQPSTDGTAGRPACQEDVAASAGVAR